MFLCYFFYILDTVLKDSTGKTVLYIEKENTLKLIFAITISCHNNFSSNCQLTSSPPKPSNNFANTTTVYFTINSPHSTEERQYCSNCVCFYRFTLVPIMKI